MVIKMFVPLRAGVSAFALAIGAVCTTAPAMAQNSVTLPSDNLEDSLNRLSRQTGRQILGDQALLRGKRAPAVQGVTSVEAALAQLLHGSGLTYRKRGNAYLIVRGQSEDQPASVAPAMLRPAPVATAIAPSMVDAVDAAPAEPIVITGTRIARPELESPMPVNVVSMDEAAQFGRLNAYEALKMSNASGLGVELASSFGQNWDAGISAVSLRNLGTNRSLTLIDGMRRVSSSARSSAVDLNMIPAAMIDRIEVVTGGAAAIYGADAVTGVVNIVTKDAIEGLHLSATGGISERGDANEYSASFATGTRFAGGRGSVVLGGTFYQTDPLVMSDRFPDWINAVPNPENTGINDGRPDNVTIHDMRQIYFAYDPTFWFGGTSWILENGVPRQADFDRRFTAGEMGYGDGGDGRNLNDTAQLRGGMKNFAISGTVNYDLTDNIRLSSRIDWGQSYYNGVASFMRYRDDSRAMYFNGKGGSVAFLDNPFLPDGLRSFMLNNNLERLSISRTYGNFPVIRELHDRDSLTLNQTISGELASRFQWKAFYQYGRTIDNVRVTDIPYNSHWVAARDVIADPVTGEPVCRDVAARNAGCIPHNIFSTDAPSQELKDYVLGTRRERRLNSQDVFGANISGALLALPYGDLSVALGAERRIERLRTVDDPLAKSGELVYSGTGFTQHPDMDVSNSVNELYGEIVAPLLMDLPFAHRLEIEGAYRFSDYSTIGETHAWKIGGSWSPVAGVTLRGVRSRSVRAPNFGELYENQVISQTGAINDPCEAGGYYASEIRAANCAALGIVAPLDDYRVGPVVTTGGNPGLEPETSNSFTLGVVLQPRFLRNFDLTVDYYDINIENVITQFSYTTVLNLCVDLPTIENQFCGLVKRDPVTGIPTEVQSFQLNAAKLYQRGIDVGARYRQQIGAGDLNLSLKGTYLIEHFTETTPGIEAGNVLYAGQWQYPRVQASLFASYQIGRLGLSLNTRFFSGGTVDANAKSQEAWDIMDTPAMIYNDAVISYDLNDKFSFSLGVKNISNVMPPVTRQTYTGGAMYDNIGRYFFSTINLSL